MANSPGIITGIVLISILVSGMIVVFVVLRLRRNRSGELVLAGTGNPNAEAFVNPMYARPARSLALDNPRLGHLNIVIIYLVLTSIFRYDSLRRHKVTVV